MDKGWGRRNGAGFGEDSCLSCSYLGVRLGWVIKLKARYEGLDLGL
jgi:hypothetical protein